MSEEEKKAIEQFKNFIFIYQDVIEDEYSDYEEKESAKEYQEVSEKILNLIEKQSKEIEELKEDNKHQWEERCKLTFELENSTPNDKIKAKIEEIDIEIQCCEYADDDTEEYKQDIEKEKRRLLRDKAVLQSLLKKE